MKIEKSSKLLANMEYHTQIVKKLTSPTAHKISWSSYLDATTWLKEGKWSSC